MALASLEEGLEDLKAGKFVIVVDDENRENEGDLVMAAECVTTDAVTEFGKPSVVDAAANLVYPLEGALMPQNVFPADVQWLTGNEGDVFEVRLEKPNALIRAFVSTARKMGTLLFSGVVTKAL